MTFIAYLIVGAICLVVFVPLAIFGAVLVGVVLNWLVAIGLGIAGLFSRKG